MKKLLALFIIILVSLLVFVGCADNIAMLQPQGNEHKPPAAVDPDEPPVEPIVGDPVEDPEEVEEEPLEPPVDSLENDFTPREEDAPEVVLENDAFKIFGPAPGTVVEDRIVVRGLARIFEATVQYEFEDGHFILDQGFTTASVGAPEWGEFEIVIEVGEVSSDTGLIVLYEESLMDGSRVHELIIPVKFPK